MFTRTGKILIVLAVIGILAGLLVALTGCTRLLDLDRHIWEPATQTDTEREEAKPPPTIEVIAGILALCGFGGMANWIRRVKIRTEKNKAKLNNHEANSTPA